MNVPFITRPTHESLIERGYYLLKSDDTLNFQVYLKQIDEGRFDVIAYKGKAETPYYHYYFSSKENAIAHADKQIAALLEHKEAIIKRRADKKSFQHNYKIGDVLVSIWGYEQTNIDFYQVTRIVGPKTIEVCEIGSTKTESGEVTPNVGHFIGQPLRRVVLPNNSIKIDFNRAHLADFETVDGVKVYKAYHYSTAH